jgi:hypothetical protein
VLSFYLEYNPSLHFIETTVLYLTQKQICRNKEESKCGDVLPTLVVLDGEGAMMMVDTLQEDATLMMW